MLSCYLKTISDNSLKTFLFTPKIDNLRKEHRNTPKVFFSQQVRKDANPEENLDLFKELLLIKPVKWDKYEQKLFSPQNEPYTAEL